MRTNIYYSLFIVLFFLSSCTKTEEVLIDGNMAPPDGTVENELIISYVSRVYISTLGREAEDAEATAAFDALRAGNMSLAARESFLDGLLSDEDYLVNEYSIARAELLNNLDPEEIDRLITILIIERDKPANAGIRDIIILEIAKLEEMKAIPDDLAAGTLTIEGMLRRTVNNNFYDDLNMGTENFVVSTFQNFLLRYPTQVELDESKTMVDGFQGSLFLQLGTSKQEYLNLLFASNDFYEGRVRYLFVKYLFRDPAADELDNYVGIYQNAKDHKELVKAILSSDEYAGL